MKYFLVLIFTVYLFQAIASVALYDVAYKTPTTLSKEGQLISLQLVMGEPIRIFVMGREEAKIDLDELKLTVRKITPYPSRQYLLSREGDSFIISEPTNFSRGTALEVTAKINNQNETFIFDILD